MMSNEKIVYEYQARDTDGTPLGSPTRLVADSPEHLRELQKTAHEEALRLAARLRKRTAVYKPGAQPTLDQATAQAVEAERAMNQEKESYLFLRQHANPDSPDYFFPCAANAAIIKAELDSEDLPWIAGNLEIVFDRIRDSGKLAKRNTPIPAPDTSEEIIPPTPKTPFDHIRTIEDVKTMSKQSYGDLFRSERWGTQFKAHINAILAGGN
jgi:hypothetical protein